MSTKTKKTSTALLLTLTLALLTTLYTKETCNDGSCSADQTTEDSKTTETTKTTTTEQPEDQTPKTEVPQIQSETDYHDKLSYHDLVLVEYFSPGCRYCQQLQPHIEQLVIQGNIPVYQVNCQDEKLSELCQKENIKGYPTIRFQTKDNNHCEYNGQMEADPIQTEFLAIQNFNIQPVTIKEDQLETEIQKLIQPLEQPTPKPKQEKKQKQQKEKSNEKEADTDSEQSSTESTEQEADEDGEEYEEDEEELQPNIKPVTLLIMSSKMPEEHYSKYKNILRCEAGSGIIQILKVKDLPFDQQRIITTDTLTDESKEQKEIEKTLRREIFLDGPNEVQDVIKMNKEIAPFSEFQPMMLRYYILSGKPFVFVILHSQKVVKHNEAEQTEEEETEKKTESEPETETVFTNLEEVKEVFELNRANKLGKLLIGLYMSVDNPQHANFIKMLGMDDSFPDKQGKTLILHLDNEKKQFYKYLIDDITNKQNLITFFKKYENQELKPYYKSDPIPPRTDSQLIETVVGVTYDEFVQLKDHKAAVLVTYVPVSENTSSNKDTEKALEMLKELAETIKKHALDNNLKEEIKVGTFNVINNEHENVTPQMKPQLKLFNKEHPEGIDFEKFVEGSIDDLKDFIKEHTGITLVHVEEEMGEEL